MNITKNYIQENCSFTDTSEKKMAETLSSRKLSEDDYYIFEINGLFYATHSECFTVEYYKENFRED